MPAKTGVRVIYRLGPMEELPEPHGVPVVPELPELPELRHLRYFAAVAEAGTVTAAAAGLHIAQPSRSAAPRMTRVWQEAASVAM